MVRPVENKGMEILRDFHSYYDALSMISGGINFGVTINKGTYMRMDENYLEIVTEGKVNEIDYHMVLQFQGDGILVAKLYAYCREISDEVPDNCRYYTSFDDHNREYALAKLREVLPKINPQSHHFDPTWSRYGY
ncbi:MAG: hypothetical protein NC489_08620 [Ruminococcus flavefaciens]|nr:hypothetical protein [Ruminococcus flavefaciens]